MAEHQRLATEFDHVAAHLQHMWGHLAQQHLNGPRFAPPVIEPPTDVFVTAESVIVLIEVAGMREQQVQLRIEGRQLTVRGEKRDRRERGPSRVYHSLEIAYGPFARTVTLPTDVDADGLQAHYDDGLLQITLPRRARDTQRTVHITVH